MRYIRIHISDVMDEIDDDDLMAAVKARKLVTGDLPFDAIERAYEALRSGDAAEALLMLERIVRPKWGSLAAAELDYAKAMAAKTKSAAA